MHSPEILLSGSISKATVLTISDQHVSILLTRDDSEPKNSIVDLTLQPFHRNVLPAGLGQQSGDDDDESTKKVLEFLALYDFNLTSESGAEYSYYDATPKSGLLGGIAKTLYQWLPGFGTTSTLSVNSPQCFGPMQSVLISPASDRQIQRASPSPSTSLVHETPYIYDKVTKPYIESIRSSSSLSWIGNILEGKKEQDRILLDTQDFLLNIDTKWRSLDPKVVPREAWYEHETVVDLYCLAILRDPIFASLRDFRQSHCDMLRSIVQDGTATIERVFGIPPHQIRVFFHYQPQFYHAHVHFTRLHNEIGAQIERGHLVSDVIQNLEMDSDYYLKRTITYKLKVTDPLYALIQEHSDER